MRNIPCKILLVLMLAATQEMAWAEAPDAVLPAGVKAVWNLDKAQREKTTTRERVCLNGLWRWQPAHGGGRLAASGPMGLFQSSRLLAGTLQLRPGGLPDALSPSELEGRRTWGASPRPGISARSRFRRTGRGRRIALQRGVREFLRRRLRGRQEGGRDPLPGGEVDLTAMCRPGKDLRCSVSSSSPCRSRPSCSPTPTPIRPGKSRARWSGAGCAATFTSSARPPAARIADVKIDTSVRKGEVTLSTALAGLAADAPYTVRVEIRDDDRVVHQFTSKPFKAGDLEDGRIAVAEKWKPEKLWDIEYSAKHPSPRRFRCWGRKTNCLDAGLPVRFGFREFWIDGRDFYLNGTRIYLSAVPLDNAQIGARTATYAGRGRP